MKTTFTLLFLLNIFSPAFSQQTSSVALASLKTLGERTSSESIRVSSDKVPGIYSFRPVTVLYKERPWHLTVVDAPDEKQVLHFTDEQLKKMAAILEVRDGKTHYLEITNFFEVLAGQEKAEVDEAFLGKMESAIRQKRWFRNNSVFILSASTVDGEPVVRFKLPVPSDRRVCRHLKDQFHLQEDYYETTPDRFMRFLQTDLPLVQQ